MTKAQRHMEQELAHLTRRLAERGAVPLVVGDEGERAVVNEAHEMQSAVRDRDLARASALRAALRRMGAGTYGFCDLCDKPIPARRLDVLPETPFCRDCASSLEEDRARQSRSSRANGYPEED